MSSGRLSRNELGWLLAQEARGAAKALRENVTLLTQPPPPNPEPKRSGRTEVQLESTLNALDDAINLITQLETGPSTRGRRGRIDLAALLYDIAPNARIAIEPGAGTEVFGEESELRRLLHVLVFQSNSPAGSQDSSSAEIRIRREGDWVRISVELGPDVSASVDLERRWLSRMAIRLGGRLELEGGTESVILPADASVDQSEVADLKKELEQAQQLGEAYARELASVFASTTEAPQDETEREPAEAAEHRFDQLVNTASALLRVLGPTLSHLREDVGLADSSSSARSLHDRLIQRTSVLAEVVGELRRVANTEPNETLSAVNVGALLRETTETAAGRAARHSVGLELEAVPSATLTTRRGVLALLARALCDHAIAATPRNDSVTIVATESDGEISIRVEDGGPQVPAGSVRALLEHRIDPASLGRPVGLSLLIAQAAARYLGGTLTMSASSNGRTSVTASWPRP